MSANFIRKDFVDPGRSLARVILSLLILMLIQDLVAQKILDDSFLNFKCSYHFLSRCLSRVGLGFHQAQSTRRPVIDDVECVHFLTQLNAAYHRYPPHLILNFDESNLYLVMAGDEMIAEMGAESALTGIQKATLHSSPPSSQKARGSRSY
jgi:hypothetical protein